MSFDLATTVINTNVVRALMVLRGFSRQSLAVAAGVREENLRAWLASVDGSELCLTLKNQVQVLRTLGVDNLQPRSDTVHLWHLDESRRSSRNAAMNALEIAVSAFGSAELIHFGRDSDEALAFAEDVYFGLRFQRFRAILRVTPGFLRDVKFQPTAIKDLGWAQVNPVCMLPAHRYAQLQKADITWQEFEDFVKGQVELQKWERLHLLAREHDISADSLAKWLVTEVQQRENLEKLARSLEEKIIADARNGISPPVAASPTTPVAEPVAAKPAPVAEVVPPEPAPANVEPLVAQSTAQHDPKADPTPSGKSDIVKDEASNVVHQLFVNRANAAR